MSIGFVYMHFDSDLIHCYHSGAWIESRDKDHFTPLLVAASQGHPDMIRLLLKNKADFEAVDKYDKTALYWAAAEGKQQALKVCLPKKI